MVIFLHACSDLTCLDLFLLLLFNVAKLADVEKLIYRYQPPLHPINRALNVTDQQAR